MALFDVTHSPNDGNREASLYEQLCKLATQLDSGLGSEEFVQNVLSLLGKGRTFVSLSLEDAFLAVLVRHGSPRPFLDEVRYLLEAGRPIRTIRRAASHARKDPSTLRRQWRSICPRRELHDLLRLIQLVHAARATGSEMERAGAVGIDVRTARNAARDLAGKSLAELMRKPNEIIAILERWFCQDPGFCTKRYESR
jgi:hypothetical protein